MTPEREHLEAQIHERLRTVNDPELKRSLVELGMVKRVEVNDGGQAQIQIELTTPACPLKGLIRAEDDAVFRLAQVSEVQIYVRDATGQELLNKTLPVSQLGSFNASVELAEDANLG